MSTIQVLVANEPRVFREAIAVALQEVRPGIATVAIDPTDLATSIDQFHPDLTICSELISAVETEVPAWVLLYPDCEDCAITCVAGEQRKTNHLTLEDLVALVDRTARARPSLQLGKLHRPPFPPPR